MENDDPKCTCASTEMFASNDDRPATEKELPNLVYARNDSPDPNDAPSNTESCEPSLA